MDQAPDSSDRIADNRAMRRFDPAVRGIGIPIAAASRHGSRLAHAVVDFGSGSRGVALRQASRPHSRSARARFPLPASARAELRIAREHDLEERAEHNAA